MTRPHCKLSATVCHRGAQGPRQPDDNVSYCLSLTNTPRAARRMRVTDEQIIQAAELDIIATPTDVARPVEGTDHGGMASRVASTR